MPSQSKKRTPQQVAERLLYVLTILVTPSIPLFFLYNRNVAQGLLFSHFLIFGGVAAAISFILYLLISRFLLRRRRTVVLLTLFWAAFWFYDFFRNIVLKIVNGDAEFPQERIIIYILAFILTVGLVLRFTRMSRFAANTIAALLCMLFAFNFVPAAIAVFTGEKQKAENEKTGVLPYEIKTEFNVSPVLPHPNVYWLHMDGLMGFDAVERYFNDPQTELQNELTERGFVINRSARLEAGHTNIAIPALTSPIFYDSYLADEFARVAQLTGAMRAVSIPTVMAKKGFLLNDIYTQTELMKAFSSAGYTIITNWIIQFESLDIKINGDTAVYGLDIKRGADIEFQKIFNFKELVVGASVLSAFKAEIDELVEEYRPVEQSEPIPSYRESVDRYITGASDSDDSMEAVVRGMKYSASVQSPHFVYYNNLKAHCVDLGGSTEIGGIDYGKSIGKTFIFDEDGNIYKERLEDPEDVSLYLPTHKYTVKLMMAQVDTIIKNDPDAVIILQADHGIHGVGNSASTYFDQKFMYERGYSLEDQLNLNLQVFSAVRVPQKYGTLVQPLDPLDIARYLVNHFVGEGNYNYLYYREEG